MILHAAPHLRFWILAGSCAVVTAATAAAQTCSGLSYTPMEGAIGGHAWGAVTADLNVDGVTDFAIGYRDSRVVSLFLNQGNGTFGTARSLSTAVTSTSIAAGDLNGDGNVDLVVAGTEGLAVLLNAGQGQFRRSAPDRLRRTGLQPGPRATR